MAFRSYGSGYHNLMKGEEKRAQVLKGERAGWILLDKKEAWSKLTPELMDKLEKWIKIMRR